MIKSQYLLPLCILLVSACSPARLQTSRLEDYRDGKPFYRLSGFTELGETAPNSSIRHIEHALSDACPSGVTIDSLNEIDAHNGAGKFLSWEAVAGCK